MSATDYPRRRHCTASQQKPSCPRVIHIAMTSATDIVDFLMQLGATSDIRLRDGDTTYRISLYPFTEQHRLIARDFLDLHKDVVTYWHDQPVRVELWDDVMRRCERTSLTDLE